MRRFLSLFLPFILIGVSAMAAPQKPATQTSQPPVEPAAIAIFAGGCFWCMQSEFSHQKGVIKTLVGYAGGKEKSPTYEQVSSGKTGHREALQVTYNPAVVSYDTLLGIFWSNVDPLDATGQFCDQGPQYKSGIFVSTEDQKAAAEASKAATEAKLKAKVATDIISFTGPDASFWPAEEYHQNYSAKNPFKYRLYRTGCGRDARLNELKK